MTNFGTVAIGYVRDSIRFDRFIFDSMTCSTSVTSCTHVLTACIRFNVYVENCVLSL